MTDHRLVSRDALIEALDALLDQEERLHEDREALMEALMSDGPAAVEENAKQIDALTLGNRLARKFINHALDQGLAYYYVGERYLREALDAMRDRVDYLMEGDGDLNDVLAEAIKHRDEVARALLA